MHQSPAHFCETSGCEDSAATSSRQWWWIIIWSVWGFIVAMVVFLLDEQPWLGLLWAMGGGLIGFFGLAILGPFGNPMLDWYRRFNPEGPLQQRRIFELMLEGQEYTEALREYAEEGYFWMCLPLAPLFGMFHGVLFGGIFGALGGSGSLGALCGVFIGPVLVACLASVTVACNADVGKQKPIRVRFARRALLVFSPLLIAPAICYSVWVVLGRDRGRPRNLL